MDNAEYDVMAQQSTTQSPQLDKDLPAYKYAKALCESARAAASPKTKTFKKKWDYFLGRDHWRNAQATGGAKIDEWAFKGIVNWLYSTVKTKASIVTGAQAETTVEALDEESTYRERQLWKGAIDQELERLKFKQVGMDLFLRGSVAYVGVAMVTARPDQLTGIMKLELKAINPEEFYCDPSADSLFDPACRFVVWEPELDTSVIREMWPDKVDKVKAQAKTISPDKSGITYSTTGDQNLIYGSSGDYIVDPGGVLKSRKARVQFVWIKDESLMEDMESLKKSNPPVGWDQFSGGTPPMMISRQYPYGRLIVYSGETLLYDGENPYELENVFPFFVYHHDRIPGDFYGTCDTDTLESLQDAQDITLSQGVDYVRLGVNGPICYPVRYKAFTELGNGPAQKLPGPNDLPWQPFVLRNDGFNTQTWTALMGAIEHNFQIVSGLASLGLGQTSSPPISATEAEIANARLSDRMKGHATSYADCMSNGAEIIREMMVQFYEHPMNVPVVMPNSEVQSVAVQVQQLPKVRIKVIINTDQAIKDKLLGQNLVQGITGGILDSPYAEMFLEAVGAPPNRIKEVMEKKNLNTELLGPGGGGAPAMGPQGSPPPLSLVPGQSPGGM